MAKSCSIGVYKISIRKTRTAGSELDLNKPLGIGKQNFYDYVMSVLQKYEKDYFKNNDTEDYLKLDSIESTKYGNFIKIQGRVESGDSGIAANLFHTTKRTHRKRSKEEAEMLPYFFCVSETNNSKFAVLCVQRFGKNGMLTNLVKCLKESFKNDFPSLVLLIEPFLPGFYIEKFIAPKQVREFKYIVLAPVADAASLLINGGVRDGEDMNVVIETRIKARRKGVMSIGDLATTNVGDILSKIIPKGVDHDKIVDKSITFESKDGETRTFRLSKLDNNALPYIEVEVKLDDNGHPAYEDVKEAVQTILIESNLY